jgi:ubiquinone/menaquinone biosynthesis C-methylase UbiE
MTTSNLPADQMAPKAVKPYKGMAMEGLIATWYAKNTRQGREFDTLARRIGEMLPAGSRLLEVAPGPGYLAVEVAKFGRYEVLGLDISKSFVEIAQANAQQAGVAADFRLGNASAMPFAAEMFDFIVCCAAFKNFTEPVQAISEMNRVLKPGGRALIIDLRRDASPDGIAREVNGMNLNWFNRLLTWATFKFMLLKNAYTPDEIRRLVAQTNFGQCEIRLDPIGMEIWLQK